MTEESLEATEPKINLAKQIRYAKGVISRERKRKYDAEDIKQVRHSTRKIVQRMVKFTDECDVVEAIKAINKQGIKDGKWPEWVDNLIDLDANPVEILTDDMFCRIYSASNLDMLKVRRYYPNYAIVVALRRNNFMANLGNYLMGVLVKRATYSDAALKLGLEVAKIYIPTQKNIQEEPELTSEMKRMKVMDAIRKITDNEPRQIEVQPI